MEDSLISCRIIDAKKDNDSNEDKQQQKATKNEPRDVSDEWKEK